MDKLKNVFHPGRAQDEEIHHGNEQSTTGKTGAFTGEGSHLVSNRSDAPGLVGSQTAGTTGASRLSSTSTGIPAEASTAAYQSRQPLATGGTAGLAGHESHLAEATSSGFSGNQTSGLGNTSHTSAGLGSDTSGLTSTSTSTAARPSTLARDAAITAAKTVPGDTGFAHHDSQSGSKRELGTANINTASRKSENPTSTTSPHMPGSWDDSFDQSRSNSYRGSSQPTDLVSSTGTSVYPSGTQRTTGLDSIPDTTLSSKSAGSEYPTQRTSGLDSNTSSSILPSTGTSSSHLGRDAAVLGTADAAVEGIHYHREERSIEPSAAASGYPSMTHDGRQAESNNTTGSGNPLGDNATNQPGHGTATLLGTTTSHSTTLPSGSSIPSTAAVTQNPHYSAGLPDRTSGSQPSSTTLSESQQPKSTVDDGLQQPSSTADYSSEKTDTTTASDKHLGRDIAVVGGAGVLGGALLHHTQDHQNLRGQYTGSSDIQPEVGDAYTGTSRQFPLTPKTRSTDFSANTQAPITSSGYGDISSSRPAGSNAEYTGTQAGNTSDQHYARDAAALGTAGAVREGIYHERPSGSSGVTSGSQSHGSPLGPHTTDTANMLDPSVKGGSSQLENASHHDPLHGGGAEEADKHHSPTETSSKEHHYGRDAAIGAGGVGAAGLVAHEHRSHENEKPTVIGNAPSTADTSAVGSSTANLTSRSKYPSATDAGSNSGNKNTSSTSTATSKDHQYGRDAAIGASILGTAGYAEHEYEKNHGDNTTGSKAVAGSSPTRNTAGPHSKDWMNKLDPRVDANPTTAQESHQAKSIVSGKQPSVDATSDKSKSTSTHKDLYYGDDAAIGASGVDAAELARREYEKHHAGNTQGVSNTAGTSQPITGSHGTGSDMPSYGSQQPISATTSNSQQQGSTSGTHYGRDAAVVAGLGTAGYEAKKHLGEHNDPSQTGKSMPSTAAGTTTTAPTHENDTLGLPSKTATNTENQHTTTGYQDPTATQKGEGHHYGSDAVALGGVGGAAYEAEHHKHDKDLTQAERDAKKQHKHAEKEAKKEHKHEESHKEKKGGLLGFLRRDKNKKYTPEEEAEFDHQERNQQTSHAGRDATLGTAGVAALGAGAYEAEKHHNGQAASSTDKSLPDAPIKQGLGTGADNLDASASDSNMGKQSSHHYGRDTSLGDSVSTGTSGLGSHVHSEATTDQYGNPIGSGTDHRTESQLQGQHHLGRDAGIGASAGGAAAVGAHEHRKHDSGYQNTISPTSQQFGEKKIGSSSPTKLHDESNAATVGSVGGAAALGDHEYRKHDTTSGIQSSTHSDAYDNTSADYGQPNASSSYTASDSTRDPLDEGKFGPKVAVGEDGRKRLHKDPPASHPAAST